MLHAGWLLPNPQLPAGPLCLPCVLHAGHALVFSTVAGCLRCLKVMAADVDSEQAPGLLQSLSAELAEIVTNPQTPAGLAATCFNIMAQLTSALASLAGKYQRQVCQHLAPLFHTHADMCRQCELHQQQF